MSVYRCLVAGPWSLLAQCQGPFFFGRMTVDNGEGQRKESHPCHFTITTPSKFDEQALNVIK
jgi:hypothetical protein